MKNVADIYPLTPLQSGMLFHTLSTDEQTQSGAVEASAQTGNPLKKGTYVNQFTCLLQGELESERLQQAWKKTIERYPTLRTAILWEGLDEPLQVVRETVVLPWQQIDWRSHSAATQKQQLADFLQRDRNKGFTLSKAPLLRLTLIQLTDNTYQFILTNHHLLYDGWSLLLIWQNVLTHYSANNTELTPPRPFKDYIAWQHQQNPKSHKTFWQTQLKDFTELTPLPAARSSKTTDHPYQQRSLLLESTFTQQLTTFARQNRLTLNTLVQSAWALLLSHYTDGSSSRNTIRESKTTETTQITYGSVVSGRPAALRGVEKMVGLFINTLPVCVSINPHQSLLPWLQERQQQLLDLREYEATPLSDIQKWAATSNTQNSPLFESIVAFENITLKGIEESSTPNLSFNITNQQYLEQSNYPLALLVFPQQNNRAQSTPSHTLDLKLLYDTDRFESDSITQLLNHLKQLLTAFIQQPQIKLSNLPRLTEQEQLQLTQFSHTVENNQSRCIHQLIEAQAAQSPSKLALTYNNRSLTYQALNQQANQLAHLLRSQGISSNNRVAICLDRSLEMIVSILSVLKAGGTYVPLDPSYPDARINYCLSDTSPHILITHSEIESSKNIQRPSSCSCLYIDQETTNTYSTTNLPNSNQPTDLAYIIYTSGSTGQPKGVMVTHANLTHSTTARFAVYKDAIQPQQPFTPERFLLLSSIAFDSSIAGIFWTLTQGGELVLAPRRIEQDLHQLANLIAHRNITCTLCVPTLYNLLLSTPTLLPKLTSLKTVIVAGEACSRTLAQRHYQQLPTALLYNEYGPTEASVWCSAYRVPHQLPPGPVSIGSPIPNTQIHLLTAQLEPVPLGAIGEICVCGNGITSGYLNQPEKTKAAFAQLTHHPITHKPFTQPISLYKTGDLGRYRPDGTLEWLGRCDRQVKIRGYRIELSEIEEALRSQPGVQEAVVVAQTVQKSAQAAPENANLSALISALEALPISQAESLLATVEATETAFKEDDA